MSFKERERSVKRRWKRKLQNFSLEKPTKSKREKEKEIINVILIFVYIILMYRIEE